MNIIEVFEKFETEFDAVEYLERIRWDGKPSCHYCKSEKTSVHASKDRSVRRWQCHKCRSAFSVTVGTVFHKTHVPLKKWFLILALMINAKKSVSSYQISRDLGLRQGTAWSIQQRIRAAMALDPEQKALFKGIVEADETYLGGKPRRGGPTLQARIRHKEDSGRRSPSKRREGNSHTPQRPNPSPQPVLNASLPDLSNETGQFSSPTKALYTERSGARWPTP